MTRTTRPALLVLLFAALALLGALAPSAAFADRLPAILKALDYVHARQQNTGGFIDASAADSPNTTPWAILAISAAREDPTDWNLGGRDPVDYLQALNLDTAAKSSANTPAYYAKTILAYRAAVESKVIIFNAGTPSINLLERLKSYRSDVDGHFSPDTAGDRKLYDISTTTWALLALVAANQSLDGDLVSSARTWLVAAQNGDGGWGLQTTSATSGDTQSTTDQTAAAIQALVAAGVSPSNPTIQRALGYLHAAQRANGGFAYSLADPRSNAESTAWTAQAIYASGQRPTDAGWLKGGTSPLAYIESLKMPNGSFAHRKDADGKPVKGLSVMMTTTQCAIALTGKPFPFLLAGRTFTSGYLPKITSFKPGNGAVFSSTNDVQVTAEYEDNKHGTGISTAAVRVTVDGVNKTKKAKISSSKLSLVLVDLSYGQHTIVVRVADKAGNPRTNTHTITVSYSPGAGVPPPGGTPTPPPTYRPPSTPGTGGATPTPTTTLYPTPAATPVPTPTPSDSGTVSGVPLAPGPSGSPEPSPSASGAAATSGEGGGGSAGLLGVTLLAMLPLGAGLSFWLHRREAEALATAGRGRLLAGGGTPWQRLKGRVPGLS